MKAIKKTFSMVLVLALMLTVLAVPASALESNIIAAFRSFPITQKTSYVPRYAAAVQRFLILDPDTTSLIADHGGVDGAFGGYTEQAVLTFQRNYGLSADGSVGPNTWAAMANLMEETADYYRYYYKNVIRHVASGTGVTYLYYISSDSDYTGTWLTNISV